MQFEEKLYDKVIQALFKAMDDVNQLLPKKEQLEKSEETVLSGESGKLDSLGLVNLIVAAERKIEEDFGTFDLNKKIFYFLLILFIIIFILFIILNLRHYQYNQEMKLLKKFGS